LIDRRRGRASGRRAPVDRIEFVVEQYRTRYWDFTVKHFHEALQAEHGFSLGYTWDESGAAEQRAGGDRATPLGAPQEAAAPAVARHDAVPRWLDARVAGGPSAPRSDRHTRRCDERDLLDFSGGGGGHRLELSRPGRGDQQARAVRLALHRSGQPLLHHPQGGGQGRQAAADPSGTGLG
jgi:hypothetical protein